MNSQIKETLKRVKLPELVTHLTPESIFDAHWNFEKDLTFEELLACETGGADDEPTGTLREQFEAMKENKFWAFSSVPENKVHLWFGVEPSFETLVMVIGHELGHLVAEQYGCRKLRNEYSLRSFRRKLRNEYNEYMRHENNADLFGVVSVYAYRLANTYIVRIAGNEWRWAI